MSETGKGLPDVTLLEPLAAALNISVQELFSGESITNRNRSSHMRRSQIYVCPLCGNIIRAVGEAVVGCCGEMLPALEAAVPDAEHAVSVEFVDGEYCVTIDHAMTREHFISFIAYVTDGAFHLVKLYPESDAQTRFPIRGAGDILFFCSRHGLFRIKAPLPTRKSRPIPE